jgi:threonine aldolase
MLRFAQKSFMKSFASDNWSGAHPEVMKAIEEANIGHQAAYGDDEYSKKAEEVFQQMFGADTKAYFVFNGTAANIVAIDALTHSFNSVICSEHAHIHVDECGALEKLTSSKMIALPSADGKLYPQDLLPFLKADRYPHQSVPKVLSITQSTELGTLYSLEELKTLADLAHEHDLYLHVDGARISNAAVSLGVDFKTMLVDTGVDVVSFGGTKNGLMFGEAVVFLQAELDQYFELYRKQGMQLFSKLRFVAAQFLALFENDLWKRNAEHSNKMAQLLKSKLLQYPDIKITQEVQSNGVWAQIPEEMARRMQANRSFYSWDERTSEYRLMCTWDTNEEDIEMLFKGV